MKILHIGKYYWPIPGGIETAVRDIAVEQVRQGHSAWILSHWQKPGQTASQEIYEGVSVLRIPIIGHMAYAPIAPSFPRTFRDIFDRIHPDIIHVHMPNLSPLWLGMHKWGVPIVVHWHSDVFTSLKSIPIALFYPAYALFQRKLLRRATAIISTSSYYRQASKPLRSFQEKTVTIPLALDTARMNTGHKIEFNIPNQPYVLSAGRFTYYKGFDVLIRAAAHLPDTIQVVIVGDGPLRTKLQDLVVELGLKDKVVLPGRLADDELQNLMAQCSVFCLPSIDRTEAFGLVLLEAMYYARPLVSTRVGGSGMQLVNEHEVTGLCVESGDESSLAGALDFLLHNPHLAQRMGKEGKKRVETEFHISSLVQNLTRLYASL